MASIGIRNGVPFLGSSSIPLSLKLSVVIFSTSCNTSSPSSTVSSSYHTENPPAPVRSDSIVFRFSFLCVSPSLLDILALTNTVSLGLIPFCSSSSFVFVSNTVFSRTPFSDQGRPPVRFFVPPGAMIYPPPPTKK